MIPPIERNGYLPAGVHQASLEELVARFGVNSDQRIAQAESLRWLVDLCMRAGKIVNDSDYRFFSDIMFVSDRKLVPKGVVEVSI